MLTYLNYTLNNNIANDDVTQGGWETDAKTQHMHIKMEHLAHSHESD